MGNRIREIRKAKGLTMKQLGDAIGLAESTISHYEKSRRQPPNDTVFKLADFFGVTVGYLLGVEDSSPSLSEKDNRDIAKDLEALMEKLDSADSLEFNGDPMSDEARESILAAMKLGLEAAKVKNKERFTPNKYRKG